MLADTDPPDTAPDTERTQKRLQLVQRKRPVMNRRRFLVKIATGDWGKEKSSALLPVVSARRLAKCRIWDTSPMWYRWQIQMQRACTGVL